jgi:hypothetical protein
MGCNSSKGATDPSGKKPTTKTLVQSENPGDKTSPSKTSKMNIQEVPDKELMKHKLLDIFGFIKAGNLKMVHGLIRYYKVGHSVMSLTGFGEEFSMTKTEKVKMANWNPLLVAIAFKKIELVKYFLYEVLASLRVFGSTPGLTEASQIESELAARQAFSMKLVVANKDLAMFNELWSIQAAWNNEHHFHQVFNLLG